LSHTVEGEHACINKTICHLCSQSNFAASSDIATNYSSCCTTTTSQCKWSKLTVSTQSDWQ